MENSKENLWQIVQFTEDDNIDTLYEWKLPEIQVDSVVNNNNETIVYFKQGETEILTNSIYQPQEFVSLWCDQFKDESYHACFIIFGLGDGRYASELRRRNKEALIIVYEPCELLPNYIQELPYSSELTNSKDVLLVTGNKRNLLLYGLLGGSLGYEVLKHINVGISPNYERLYPEEISMMVSMVREMVNFSRFNRNTILVYNNEMRENISKNFLDAVNQSTVSNIIKTFGAVDKDRYPAVVIGAGPSLDKNVQLLKEMKGKAFLIAVDTALNTLAKAGVSPDIAITIDGHKPLKLFENDLMSTVPLVFDPMSHYRIRSLHGGRRFYEGSGDSVISSIYAKYGKSCISLESGGSVANNAFSLAQRLGFKTIIFVGQDLAYPNDQEHAKDAYDKPEENIIKENGKEYFWVDDNYGGKIKTEYNMNMYRQWFERATKIYYDIRFINATEGGAKIDGMEFLTLREAIDETCVDNQWFDFAQLLNEVEATFSKEELSEIYKLVSEYEITYNDAIKRIEKGISDYKKMRTMCTKGKMTTPSFLKLFKKVSAVNDWIAKDPEMSVLTLYSAKDDYEVKGIVYDQKESDEEEMLFTIDNGIRMLESIRNSCETFLCDMKENICEAKRILEEMTDAK